MLILRIRQAETALDHGRLDEAYELAGDPDLRAHRRGQELISRLARAFVERGREHLANERCMQALADCEKAGKLGGNLADAAELRTAIVEAQSAQQRQVRKADDAVAVSRQYIDAGQLSLAEGALVDLDATSARVTNLQRQVTVRKSEAEACLDRAQRAMEREDWDTAIDALREAGHAHSTNHRLNELTAQVTSAVMQQVRAAIDEGRLLVADSLMKRLKPLVGETDLHVLRGVMDQCRQALWCIEHGQLRSAGEILGRLDSLLPNASWPGIARDAIQQAAGSLECVRGGPLGLLSVPSGEHASIADMPPGENKNDVDQTMRIKPRNTTLPSRFMLQVDGVGSYLVLRDRRVTIGPISSSQRPDVGLMAEPGLPVASIERTDEDYFIVSDRSIAVNDTPVTRRLLADGDKIALSPRCRIRFTLPNAASTSAVLNLSGTRLPRGDARRVILMDRSLVIGPGSATQIRAEALTEPVILYVQNGQLLCQSKEQIFLDEQQITERDGIRMGAQVRVGPLTFVVTEA